MVSEYSVINTTLSKSFKCNWHGSIGMGRKEKKKKRQTGAKGLAKLTAHYETMIF